MSVPKTKDILSLLQSRIALRANFLVEYAPNGGTDWPAVEDQKADKKAVAEIVKLRREMKRNKRLVSCLSVLYSVAEGYQHVLPISVSSSGHKRIRWNN